MKTNICALAGAVALATSSPALAGNYASRPLPSAADAVTYNKGTPVMTRETATATITVLPTEAYFGRPSFLVEVTNHGTAPINFGVENIAASVAGEKKPTVVYDRKTMEAQAQNRAGWATVLATLAAASAGTSYYSSTTHTPYGSYRTHGSYRNAYASQAAADRYTSAISAGLEARLADARENAIQTTTIQPGESYGGRIVISKPKAKLPGALTLTVMGEAFAFTIAK